jgi:flagellin-like hook-associated protein FlgL
MADITLTASVRQSLLSLQSTQDMVGRTQKRLSSGLEVENAIDDAIAYFQAKALNDRSTDLLEKKDNIDQGVSTIATALDGVTAIEEIVAQMKGVANSMKSAQQSQMSNLISTFQELRTQINNVAADSTYQGLNLINGTGANLAVEFSEKTSSKIDVASVDLRNNTGGLDVTNPVTYTQTEVLGVIANLADASTVSNGEIHNRYLTTADVLTFTWNAGPSTFRAGETIEFTYGTGGAVNFFIGTSADLAVTNTGTVTVTIYSTSTTATTDTIYAMATASRNFICGFASQVQSMAATNAADAGTYTAVFTFTYHGTDKITLTTADNGLNIGTGFGGDAQMYIGQGDSLIITTGEVVTLFTYSADAAGSAAAVAQSRDAYLIATGLQAATKCLATADTQAFT